MAIAMALWTGVEALGPRLGRPISPFQVVWTRYAVHLAVLLVLVGVRQRWRLLHTKRPGLQLLRSSMMLSMPLCFVLALRYQSERETWAIFWWSPIVTMVVGWAALAEPRPPLHRWATAGAGMAMMGVILAPSAPGGVTGPALSTAMGMSFVGYLALTRVLRAESTESKLLYTALGVFLALCPVLPFVWEWPTPRALAVMSAIGVVGLGGLWALDRAFDSLPVSWAAPFAYAQGIWLMALLFAQSANVPASAIAAGGLALLVAAYSVQCDRPREVTVSRMGGEGPGRGGAHAKGLPASLDD
jgi:drug/metabolite transporter (DMT)-like permease